MTEEEHTKRIGIWRGNGEGRGTNPALTQNYLNPQPQKVYRR
jgi:hypothetical protein